MGQLRKTTCRLLKQVGNQPHASSDDHEDDTRTPREPPIYREVETLPSVLARSVAKVETPPYRPTPQLPQNLAKTNSLELKRKHPEVVDLLESPPKRHKALGKENFQAKSKAERSLPSPAQTESVKSGTSRKGTMQTEYDFNADPQSSSEVEQASTIAGGKRNSNGSTSTGRSSVGSIKSNGRRPQGTTKRKAADTGQKSAAESIAGFKSTEKLHLTSVRDNKAVGKPEFRAPGSLPNYASDDQLDDSDDGEIFASQSSQKKHKRGPNAPRSSQQSVGYGKQAKRKVKIPKSGFQKPATAPQKPAEPAIKFKKADLNDGRLLRTSAANGSVFKPDEPLDDSEMLLTERRDDDEEVDDGKVECKICNERLRKTLQEQFEDEILKDKSWNFKWQGRFCLWHKRKTAHEIWQEREYPDLDWTTLRERMRKHDKYILDVLNDRVKSYHRDKLQEESKHGRSRQKDIVTDGNGKFIMGYYGQKGEQQVHEYIMTRFADALRKRSTKDKLILATGIQGGVNGFVQLVLAPHLVELLVKEDLKLNGDAWEDRAREVLAESAEIGELLFPEEHDKVGDNAYEDHIVDEHDDDLLLDIGNDEDDIEVVELE
ncbi:Putative restriction of telomere capping protein [Septoria linicola]|uniref:Restriction of telomere capping protein 4 n=1 Tax=Septoria linicola TaxID=215465 RepID=A0A9Q9ASB9_9PEZI|nr:putative restriction of telomere capping protein [Septoria linicola]USW54529.1 Putative restriction of telomere capping protein [Septoria linicola]